jgi:uncharacterized protein (DUF2126 family)
MRPYASDQWQAIYQLGQTVDHHLTQAGVGLTMGGEPTYVAAGNSQDSQWRYAALGDEKRQIAGQLLRRLQHRLTLVGSLRHYGLGKLYPSEPTPRWALGCFWRRDGEPLWRNPKGLADDGVSAGHGWEQAKTFMVELIHCLALPPEVMLTAWERDQPDAPTGFAVPLLTVQDPAGPYWASCRWHLAETGHLALLPGDSALGLRLPLGDLPTAAAIWEEARLDLAADPIRPLQVGPLAPDNSIRLALGIEARQGTVHVFLPPIAAARSFVDLLTAIEATAESLDMPVVIEGYGPPDNQGIEGFQITPDPGVLEVNIHPAQSWAALVQLHQALDAEAIACGLACERYGWDGRPLGTGGGAHITIGGDRPDTSPLLRRPDLLRSLITYWQHHPSLSYLFAGEYIGATSQAPRPDETRADSLYELEVAFLSLVPHQSLPPALVDQLLGPLLVDRTGNRHRAALCIDKLFPRQTPRLQLGLLEFRGFEMPPCTELRLLQMLLVRALVAWFWQQPYTQPLRRWGAELRDRYRLPYGLEQDFHHVLQDLAAAGFAFDAAWFAPFWDHRMPRYGCISLLDNPARQLELRAALEPWPVVGDTTDGGPSRPVDNSLERIQVRLTGAIGDPPQVDALASRYAVLCNGHRVPLRSTGRVGEYVGAVRFRARALVPGDHWATAPHAPLHFTVLDTWQQCFAGGAIYHVQSPDGHPYPDVPPSPEVAAARFRDRLEPSMTGTMPDSLPPFTLHPETPFTLDLRLSTARQPQ